MEYAIGMSVISWVIAICMLLGFLFIKSCEQVLKLDDDESIKEWDRFASQTIVDKFNSMDFTNRVVFIMTTGFYMVAFILFGRDRMKK